MNDRSRLYFEGHITIEPPADAQQTSALENLAVINGFRMASFTQIIGKEKKHPDAFVSIRHESYAEIVRTMDRFVALILDWGYVVKRVKIENTLLDTNQGDLWPGVG